MVQTNDHNTDSTVVDISSFVYCLVSCPLKYKHSWVLREMMNRLVMMSKLLKVYSLQQHASTN